MCISLLFQILVQLKPVSNLNVVRKAEKKNTTLSITLPLRVFHETIEARTKTNYKLGACAGFSD